MEFREIVEVSAHASLVFCKRRVVLRTVNHLGLYRKIGTPGKSVVLGSRVRGVVTVNLG